MYHVHQSKDEIKGQEKGGRMVEREVKGEELGQYYTRWNL